MTGAAALLLLVFFLLMGTNLSCVHRPSGCSSSSAAKLLALRRCELDAEKLAPQLFRALPVGRTLTLALLKQRAQLLRTELPKVVVVARRVHD